MDLSAPGKDERPAEKCRTKFGIASIGRTGGRCLEDANSADAYTLELILVVEGD